MKKRGQLEMSFKYIFIVIVIVLILVFGFKAISNIMNLGGKVELADFLNSVNQKINQYYYLDKGSTQKFELIAPSNVEHVCFLDKNGRLNSDDIPDHEFSDTLKINLGSFDDLIILGETLEDYKLERAVVIEGSANPICIDVVNGRVKFRLTNTGTGVKIEEIEEE
jgi:hypothetical protein